MQLANQQLKAALDSNDAHAAMCADAAFHQVLLDAAENPELSALLDHLKVKYRRIELAYFGHANSLLASFEEHQMLISAVETKKIEAANQALASNWQASIERLRRSGGQS